MDLVLLVHMEGDLEERSHLLGHQGREGMQDGIWGQGPESHTARFTGRVLTDPASPNSLQEAQRWEVKRAEPKGWGDCSIGKGPAAQAEKR